MRSVVAVCLVLICSVVAFGQLGNAPQVQGRAGQAPAPPAPFPGLPSELQQAARTLMDWPNLARYASANAQLPPPAANEDRVVFMGDSITDGWTRRFPQSFPGKPYVNRGISGQTTPQMLIRFRPDVIALKAKVVVILAGTNEENLEKSLATLRQARALQTLAEMHQAAAAAEADRMSEREIEREIRAARRKRSR